MLSFSLLGPFEVRSDGESLLPFRTVKGQALLAYLVTEGRPARREALMALLWPGMPEASARQNLRQTLYLLRQELPSVPASDGSSLVPLLLSDRQTVRMNPEARFSADVARFQRLIGDGSRPALEEAVALYRGDFLADFYLDDSNEFEEWAAAHRARLQRQALDALETLAAHYLEEAAYERAEQYARRQLELDSLRESAYGQLMQALAQSGRRSAAIAAYERCRTELRTELGVEPAAETRALYEQIQNEAWPTARTRERHAPHPSALAHIHSPATEPSLPHVLTPFFGREEELAQIRSWLLGPDNRLVTLVGPGGSGKTRLAVEAGRALQQRFAHGVHFVSLAEMDDDDLFEATVASTLGVSLPPGIAPEQQLTHFLRGRELLLIVDNFEHSLLSAHFLVEWLEAAPGFRVLATSREPLGIYGESLLRVEGLEVAAEGASAAAGAETAPEGGSPGATNAGARNPAVALFLNHARRVNPDLALAPDNEACIHRICRLLQGNPLALELVAPWTRHLSCHALEAQIRRGLDLFSDSPHGRPARHRSLRALFDYTWSRLDAEEQSLLQQLAVFRGDMSLEAAAEVAGITLPQLAALVDKSLLRESSADRYEMHVHLRKYAREQPQQEPQKVAAATRRHAAYYADYMGQRAGSLEGGRALKMIQEITREIDNIRAAWTWAADSADGLLLLQMTVPLLLFYEIRGWYTEAMERFAMASTRFSASTAESASASTAESASASTAESEAGRLVSAYLLATYGWFAHRLGRYQAARPLFEESLRLGRALGDVRLEAFVVSAQALVDARLGNVREAERAAAESLALAEQVGDPLSKAFSLVNVGFTTLFHGHYERAHEIYREALEAFRGFDNDYGAAICLVNLGHISMRVGAYDEAIASCLRARELCEGTGYQFGLGNTLRNLAETYLAKGGLDQAERYAAQSLRAAEEIGDREGYAWAELVLGLVAQAHGDLRVAEQFFSHGGELFGELNQTLGVAEAACQLGALALAAGEPRQATRELQKSMTHFRRLGHDEGIARAHSLLGELYLQEGASAEAAAHFRQSLVRARTVELPPLKLALLYRSARLLLPDQPLSAGATLRLIADHPATDYRLRREARRRLQALQATLPPLQDDPHAWRERPLDEYVEKMLGSLEEWE